MKLHFGPNLTAVLAQFGSVGLLVESGDSASGVVERAFKNALHKLNGRRP